MPLLNYILTVFGKKQRQFELRYACSKCQHALTWVEAMARLLPLLWTPFGVNDLRDNQIVSENMTNLRSYHVAV